MTKNNDALESTDTHLNSLTYRFAKVFAGRKDARGTIEGGCIRETLNMGHIYNDLHGKESLGRYPLLDSEFLDYIYSQRVESYV